MAQDKWILCSLCGWTGQISELEEDPDTNQYYCPACEERVRVD